MPSRPHQTIDGHQKSVSRTVFLAVLVGLAFRLLFIGQAPGLHFDEAWAANYAARIASEPGFWPINAMSPYTHPWSHYVTALFFKGLGIHLWTARGAGIAMSAAGIFLLARALLILEGRRALSYFACLVAVSVPSILNERFAIEINTFHVLCLGLLVYGLAIRSRPLIAVASVIGVSSHILFLAPVLAAFWVWASSAEEKTKRDRVLIGGVSLALLPFFLTIYLGIPEKGKALVLLVIDSSVLALTIYPVNLNGLEKKLRWVLLPVVVVFFAIVLVLMQGDLSIAFTYGIVSQSWVSYLLGLVLLATMAYLLPHARRQINRDEWPKSFAKWGFYLLFLVSIMSTKPAPRYFEMIFLVVLGGAAVTLSKLRSEKSARMIISALVLVSAIQWRENYILPALHHQGVDRDFRYLIFHDNSSDSLSKQNLVSALGAEGCSPSQVSTSDPRLGEALQFLARGDWTVDSQKRCSSSNLRVERAATGAGGRRIGEFTAQLVTTLPSF